MSTINCDDTSSFGAQQIDQTHQHLLELLNALYTSISNAPQQAYQGQLDDLIDYAIYHFICEEYWMNKNMYPYHWDHRREHEAFFHRVAEISKALGEGNNLLTLHKLSFLIHWLNDHKFDSDAKYGSFLANKSIIPK
jgi:hemerythrin-like metal-binding protein